MNSNYPGLGEIMLISEIEENENLDPINQQACTVFAFEPQPGASTETTNRIECQSWNWTVDKTKLLLDLYKVHKAKVGTFHIKNLKKLWEFISKEINKILKTHINPHHVENRWRVLDRAYKKYVDNQGKTGQGRKYFEYAQEMDEIFKSKRNIKPVLLLSTDNNIDCPIKADVLTPTPVTSALIQEEEGQEEDSTEGLQKLQRTPQIKRKRNPILNRNIILEQMKQDKKTVSSTKIKSGEGKSGAREAKASSNEREKRFTQTKK